VDAPGGSGRLHHRRAGPRLCATRLQRGLTERLGTLGATHVRFLFGLPFGLVFLASPGGRRPRRRLAHRAWAAWTLMGAVFQIAAPR